MSRTPARTTTAAENQATIDAYLEGWSDLNQALRSGEPWSGNERNAAFLGNRQAGDAFDMVDVAPLLGLDHDDDGRSAVRIDIDFDGDDDLVVSNRTSPRIRVLANRLADGAPFLAVEVAGQGKNSNAVGAVVFATPVNPATDPSAPFAVVPGVTQRRSRTIGSGYLAQSSRWLRFHPAKSTSGRAPRMRLAVRWPDGGLALEDFGVVRADKHYRLAQSTGRAVEVPRPAPATLKEGPVRAFPEVREDSPRRLVLPAPTSIASLLVRSTAEREARLFGMTPAGPRGAGKPAVVVVWDSRVPRAIEDLGGDTALTALCEEANEFGALVVAIDLAGEGDGTGPDPLELGAIRLQSAGYTGDILAAVGEASTVLRQVVAWRLDRPEPPALPWSLLIGADGRLDVVRTGAWSPGDTRKDLTFCAASGDERAALAAPFGGHWLEPPAAGNVAPLQRRLERVGAKGAVRELDLARVTTVAPNAAEVHLRVGQSMLESQDLEGALARFEAAVEVDGKNPQAHRAKAYALHLLGRYEDALAAWTQALAMAPDDVVTRGNRGLAAVAAGKLDVARADLEALVKAGSGRSREAMTLNRAIQAAEANGDGSSK